MVTNPKLRSTLARHCTSHNQFVHNQKGKLLPSRILSVINFHCMKSVQTRSFFWSVFSCIQSEQLRPLCYYCLCYFNTYYLHLFCDYYNTIININIVIITSHQYCLYLYYFTRKHISTGKLVKMAQFVLTNNFPSLIMMFSSKYLEQQLVLNFLSHAHVFLWIKSKLIV